MDSDADQRNTDLNDPDADGPPAALRYNFSFSGGPFRLIFRAMNAVTLPPELEHFANEAVANGRYHDVSELVRVAVSLLQRTEAERAVFVASLEEAEAESVREGFLTIDEVKRDVEALIEEMARTGS